ncbi:neuropeptide Y receptor type 1 [Engraulis encrasicolus]|uniref:neuropeptide Y receptor type 1 n=1 Tax=Engraulis encrasicolus TaxID=184585 RepID=UPI002FD09C35
MAYQILLPPLPPTPPNCSTASEERNCSFSNLSTSAAYGHEDECDSNKTLFVIMAIAYCAVALLGVLGNLALVLAIVRQREMHNVTNVLIANLSLSDLLMSLVCLPFTFIYTFMDHWVFGEFLCKLNGLVQCCSITVSIFSLVLIAMERHQLILHPRGWRPTTHHACMGIAAIWTLGLATATPFLLFSVVTDIPLVQLPPEMSEQFKGKVVCIEMWPSTGFKLTYTTSMLFLQYITPLLFIFVCYYKIYIRLRRRHCMREGRQRSGEVRRINIMLFSIVVAFAVCWLPLNVFNAIHDWYHEAVMNCTHNPLFSLCHLLAMASAGVNPIFYGFLNRNFQQDIRGFPLCRLSRRRQQEEYDTVAMSTMHTEVSRTSFKLSSLDI